jgi:hypothetical protein
MEESSIYSTSFRHDRNRAILMKFRSRSWSVTWWRWIIPQQHRDVRSSDSFAPGNLALVRWWWGKYVYGSMLFRSGLWRHLNNLEKRGADSPLVCSYILKDPFPTNVGMAETLLGTMKCGSDPQKLSEFVWSFSAGEIWVTFWIVAIHKRFYSAFEVKETVRVDRQNYDLLCL